MPCGVDLILGLNGYIWVSKSVKTAEQEGEEGFDAEGVYSNVNDVCLYSIIPGMNPAHWYGMKIQDIDEITRTAISRVTNIVRILASHFKPLTDTLLMEAYDWTVSQVGGVRDLLTEDFSDALVAWLASKS